MKPQMTRVDPALYESVRKLAMRQGRTISIVLNEVIGAGLKALGAELRNSHPTVEQRLEELERLLKERHDVASLG